MSIQKECKRDKKRDFDKRKRKSPKKMEKNYFFCDYMLSDN